MEGSSNKIVEQEICRQCPESSPCMAACPVNAMSRDEKTGAVIINYDLCTGCKECTEACSDGGVWYNEALGKVVKCDLCEGDPQCVKWCPIGALVYEKVE